MSDATDHHELPPLGTPTPLGPERTHPSRPLRQLAVVAAVALLVGVASGFALASAVDDSGESAAPRPAPDDQVTTMPPPTEEPLPEECVATMRAAQETLALLDRGLRDLRNLNLGEVDRAVNEVQRLRTDLDDDVRRCLEKMGD